MRQFIFSAAICYFITHVIPCLAGETARKSEQTDEYEAVMAQIRRDWDFRRSKLGAIWLVVEGSCIVRKGMNLDLGPDRFGFERSFPPADYCSPHRTDVTIDFAGKRIRRLSRFDVVHDNGLVPTWVTQDLLILSDGQIWSISHVGEENPGYDAEVGHQLVPVLSKDIDGLFPSCTFAANSNHRLEVKPWTLKARLRELEETNHGRIVRLCPAGPERCRKTCW